MQMKHLKHISVLLMALLAGISCSREVIDVNQEITLDYQVNVSEMTKAFGEGDHVNYIWYAIYNEDGTFFMSFPPAMIKDGVAHCTVTFIKDQKYKVVFVGTKHDKNAEGQFVPVYDIDTKKGVIKMPSSSFANSEELDCFFGTDAIIDNSCVSSSVTLERITSQINFIFKSGDWDASNAPVQSSLILAGVSDGYDMLKESYTTTSQQVTYDKAPVLDGQDLMVGADYRVCSVYCLSGSDVTVSEMKVYDATDAEKTPVTGLKVPIAGNMKTNVYCKVN